MISRYEVKEISKIWNDQHKFETYLKYELALMQALENNGIGKKGIFEDISNKVTINPQRIYEIEKEVKHDVIAFCSSVTEQISEEQARLFHYGVTSSDVIDTSINMMIRDSLKIIDKDFKELLNALFKFSTKNKMVPCMGRSHGINAEPLSLGVKFLGHYCEFSRRYLDLHNFIKDEITLQCSGAVGNYTILDTEIEKEMGRILNLKVEEVSTQVIPRDRINKLMGIISAIGAGIDRICIELRHLQHSNISEVSEGFSTKQKGSSTMPHKKNPISAENLSGISRILKSYYQVSLENNNLWHERDISHSSAERFILPDSLGLTSYALRRLKTTIEGLVVHTDNINSNIPKNLVFLSSFALHELLKNTDLRREDLYKIVQKASFKTFETGQEFTKTIIDECKKNNIDFDFEGKLDALNLNDIYLSQVENIFMRAANSYPLN